LQKYISHVWDTISIDDYKTLLQKTPNEKVEQHEIYQEYIKKIKAKNDQERWNRILALEQNKLLYFIIAYPQKLVLVKTGEKKAEKQFLGYEFSNRRGSEGIHPIQRSKSIDDCTQLYDADSFTNPEKASTYIYKAFNGEFDLDIAENLKPNISYQNLVDMLTFDRVDFEKNISLSAKKKVKFESKWSQIKLGQISMQLFAGGDLPKNDFSKIKTEKYQIPIYANSAENKGLFGYTNQSRVNESCITISARGTIGYTVVRNEPFFPIVRLLVLIPDIERALSKYLEILVNQIDFSSFGAPIPQLTVPQISDFKIPLPPIDIQEKIVAEIKMLEKQEQKAVEEIDKLSNGIFDFYKNISGNKKRLDEICELKAGQFVKADNINKIYNKKLLPCYGGNGLRGYTETFTNEGQFSLIGRQGALCGNVHLVSGKFHATEHALVAYPKKDIHTIWLHYQLVFMNLNQYASGTAQPGLSVMNLNPIEISAPTLKEQKKIIAGIEKIEKKIADSEKQIELIPNQKELILKKYLE